MTSSEEPQVVGLISDKILLLENWHLYGILCSILACVIGGAYLTAELTNGIREWFLLYTPLTTLLLVLSGLIWYTALQYQIKN